jgi:muramoyltetrapeptide carboxypeptidase
LRNSLIKPGRLSPGQTIGIVAPASAPPDPHAIDRSVAALEGLGFTARLAPRVRNRWGYLAGNDRDRAGDLMDMFAHPKVDAIFCVRGGYGTPRLLPVLDYDRIRSAPKILMGYSDITALHCALLRKAGLISFHGPMLNSDLIKPKCPSFTLQGMVRTLSTPSPPGSVSQGLRKRMARVLHPGMAEGRLIGGNLSLLCCIVGTPYEPQFKNRILFFEDVDEKPYRFDRMLTQLLNAGLLQQVAGVAIGTNEKCHDPKARQCREYRQTLEDVFIDRLRPLKIPVVMNLPFGHRKENATLPVGARARLDATAGDLEIVEAAVT